MEFDTNVKPTKAATKGKKVAEVVEEELEAVAETEANEASETPQYNPEELLRIFDEVMFAGEYTETVNVRNKLKLTFRSRSTGDIEKITRYMDTNQFNLISTYQQQLAIQNLSYSLVGYNNKDLSDMTPEKRREFILGLNGFIMGMIVSELGKFDMKMEAAFREAEENF